MSSEPEENLCSAGHQIENVVCSKCYANLEYDRTQHAVAIKEISVLKQERDRLQQQVFVAAKELQAKEDLRLTNIADLMAQRDAIKADLDKKQAGIETLLQNKNRLETEVSRLTGEWSQMRNERDALMLVPGSPRVRLIPETEYEALKADNEVLSDEHKKWLEKADWEIKRLEAQLTEAQERIRQLDAARILGDAAVAVARGVVIKENEVLIPYLEMKSRAEKAEAERSLQRGRAERVEAELAQVKAELADMKSPSYVDRIWLGADRRAEDLQAELSAAGEREAVLREALSEAYPAICGTGCPAVWKTGTERPHSLLCGQIQKALAVKENPNAL